jgi:hypothetical protein
MPLFQKMDDKILHIEENNTKSFIEAENTKMVKFLAILMTFN